MQARIILFDKNGTPLAEVSGQAPRSWLLNKFGQAKIRIPLTALKPDGALSESDVRVGNLVLIEHDRVGDWVGVLALPQVFDETSGEMELTAYSAEWLLLYRRPSGNTGGSRGQTFERQIKGANRVAGVDFRVGEIDRRGGQVKVKSRNFESIYDLIVDQLSGEIAGNDWGVTHDFTQDGRLYFVGNWYGVRGESRPNVALWEGHNMRLPSGAVLTYEGEIINDVEYAGEKEREQQRSGKPEERAKDAESIATYGIFQKRKHTEATNPTEIEDMAATLVAEQAQPRKRFRIEALDVNNSFDFLHLGDVVPVRFVRAGFFSGQLGMEAEVRIIGKAFDELEGYLTLTVVESVL